MDRRRVTDLVYSVLPFDLLTPRQMMKVTFDVMQLSAQTLKSFWPGQDSRVVWQEFNNKLQAFDLFENADSVLGVNAKTEIPLTKLVEKAHTFDSYSAVWVTEGLGHFQAERCWERTGVPKDLLRSIHISSVPRRSLTALHAGMGLSLSNRLLETVETRYSEAKIFDVLQQFINLCRDNSAPGYVGAAYEALGLTTRNLYPHLVKIIDRKLQQIDEKLVSYFWHGVGRAIYFAPTNFLLSNNSPWRAVKMAESEPVHDVGRLNALTGLVWAIVLVNIRHPEILEALLRCHGSALSQSDALSNGVSSAIMIWCDSTGDDSWIEALYQYQPQRSDLAVNDLWNKYIVETCRNSLQRFYPVIKEQNCWGEIFQYQSLPELVVRLERNRGGCTFPAE